MSHEPEPTDALERLADLNRRLAAVRIDPTMFAGIIDALPDGLIVIDESSRMLLVNAQAELLFGYPRTKLIGESIHMLLPPDLTAKHAAHLETFFANPMARPMNASRPLMGRHANGRPVKVQVSIGPLISEFGIFGMAVIRRACSGL